MTSKKIKTPLVLDRYYHIYNRGNNNERIFFQKKDYEMFMEKYKEMVHPYVNTYAYCLLPNHYHFLIKINSIDPTSCNKQPSHIFRKFFQFYAIWFNNERNRRGSLFTKYYRRIEITDEDYLRQVVYYIHRNPVKHGLTGNYKIYPYSSFSSYSSYKPSIISRNETLSWFNDDLVEFLNFHNVIIDDKPDFKEFTLED